jgi:hypothetical protein
VGTVLIDQPEEMLTSDDLTSIMGVKSSRVRDFGITQAARSGRSRKWDLTERKNMEN